MTRPLRLVCTLVGDVNRQPDMRIKYGGLLDELSRRFDLIDVYDASLRGFDRYWNALQTFRLDKSRWKQRFFKNVAAFKAQSRRISGRLHDLQGRVDLALQIGATFDSTWANNNIPVMVYTDNTTYLSARSTDVSRFPFSKSEFISWLELESRLYHHANHICVRADLVRRSLLYDYKVPDSRISVVGGGVNFSSLPTVNIHKSTTVPTALFVGQNFHRKGGDLVLRAFAKTRIYLPHARLLCVTADPVPDDLPLDGVVLLPLTWDRNAIADLYRQADVFILPSRHETWGDVLLEAMAFGVPCIGVTGQAMEEIVRPEQTGFLAQPENIEDLSQAVTQLLSQPDLRKKMGEAARKLVLEEYTWSRVAERLEVAARKLLLAIDF